MSNVPADLRYTKTHEYMKATGGPDVYFVGITDWAQGQLGDVVFVELPQAGQYFDAGAAFGSIEAVKAVSYLYSPVSGMIVAANDALDANPPLVNSDPYGAGWMIQLRPDDPSSINGLLTAAQYQQLVG